MGAWGKGPFDNDAAADFLGELHYAPARSITKALKRIAKTPVGQYIEVDEGSAAWAACELVALSFGYGDFSTQSDSVLDIVGRLKPKEDQRLLALSVVSPIGASESSELAALWREGDAGEDHDSQLRDLRARLEAASAGPRVVPQPKRGDVIYLPDTAGSTDGVVLQVVAAGEVAVFEGTVSGDEAALAAIRTRPARRVPTAVNKLLRSGHHLGNCPVRKDLKGRKLYAAEIGAIEEYILSTANAGGVKIVSYHEARECDVLRPNDASALRAAALGQLPMERPRSPEEREAELCERNREKWDERRKLTTPGPFGDVVVLERLVAWIDEYGISNAIERFSDLARGAQGYGRPNEAEERRPYAFAGMVALWRGKWPANEWPDELADRVPSVPGMELYAKAQTTARVLVEQVLSRDAELRLIWDGAPDGGASLRASLDMLKKALA